MTRRESPGDRIQVLWRRLHRLPGGAWLFSRALGLMVPYTETIRPLVRELRSGHCRTELRERRRVQNHLASVHAVAVINLGEVTSGLAVLVGLEPGVRGIVTALSAEYVRKARGRLVAVCTCQPPVVSAETDFRVTSEIRNEAQEVVARVHATWRLAPREAPRVAPGGQSGDSRAQ